MNGEGRPGGSSPRDPYLGSVLFFKHLILAAVIVMILVPSVLAVLFYARNRGLGRDLAEVRAALSAAEQSPEPIPSADPPQEEAPEGEVPAYTLLYPDLYAPEAELGSSDPDMSVYLTFDDGPSPRTDEVLEILDRYGVKATFFVVGSSDEAGAERMRAIVQKGHTLAIHSYTHDYRKIYASVEAYLADFNELYCRILEATGVAPTVFRFPGGSINGYNGSVYREIIAEMTRRGFVYFDWNVSSGDAAGSTPTKVELLTENALKGTTTRRAIVLMHDSAVKTTTVAALPAIIEGYRAAGFTFYPLTAETRSVTFGYRD